MELWKQLMRWWKKPPPADPSLYAEEYSILSALARDESVYGDVRYIETGIADVESYCRWLDTLSAALHEDIEFPKMELIAHRVKRCNFWRNMKGEFIDVIYFSDRFKRLAEKVLRRHEALIDKPTSAPLARSMLRAQPLIFDLKRVIRQL